MIFFPKPDPIKISLLSDLIHKRYRNPYGGHIRCLSLPQRALTFIYQLQARAQASVLSDKSLLDDGGGLSQDI